MKVVPLLNRILFAKIPDLFYVPNIPVFLGTIRGGHTSVQNWINVSILDYLNIEYSINPEVLNIIFTDKNNSKPLEPLDLRSIFPKRYPYCGYISNDPGHAINLKNRLIFIFLRAPQATYQSIYVLSRFVYGYDQSKAKHYAFRYIINWGKRLSKLIKNKKKNNLNLYFFKSDNIFSEPSEFIHKILKISTLYIPKASIQKSIENYNKKTLLFRNNMSPINPRNSYRDKYISLSLYEKEFINDSYLNNFYLNHKEILD